jgi:hypothetical protein
MGMKGNGLPDTDGRALDEYRREIEGGWPDSSPSLLALPDGRYRLEIRRGHQHATPKIWTLAAFPVDPPTLLASVADPDPIVHEIPTFPRNLLQSLLMNGPLSLEGTCGKLGPLIFAGMGLDCGLLGIASRFTEEEKTPDTVRSLLDGFLWNNRDLAMPLPDSKGTLFAHLASVAGSRVRPWQGYSAWMARDAALAFLEQSAWRLPSESPAGTWNDMDPAARKTTPPERTGRYLLEAIADYFEDLQDRRFSLVCTNPDILQQCLTPHVGFLRGLFVYPDGDPYLKQLLKMEKNAKASAPLDWAIWKTGADTSLANLARRHMANRAVRPEDSRETFSPLL